MKDTGNPASLCCPVCSNDVAVNAKRVCNLVNAKRVCSGEAENVSQYIRLEAELALNSFLLGLVLMISYDFLRLFRLFVHHGKWWTGLEDLVYWVYCAIMTFRLLFYQNSGVLRGYVIACVFLGMFLYDAIVSRSVFRVLKNLGRWITMKKRNHRLKREKRSHGTEPQP